MRRAVISPAASVCCRCLLNRKGVCPFLIEGVRPKGYDLSSIFLDVAVGGSAGGGGANLDTACTDCRLGICIRCQRERELLGCVATGHALRNLGSDAHCIVCIGIANRISRVSCRDDSCGSG